MELIMVVGTEAQSQNLFLKYSNSHLKTKTGIGGLKDEQGVLITCDETKAATYL